MTERILTELDTTEERQVASYNVPELESYIQRLENAITKAMDVYNDAAQEVDDALYDIDNIEQLDADINTSHLTRGYADWIYSSFFKNKSKIDEDEDEKMQQRYNFKSASDELKASFDEYVDLLSKIDGFLKAKLDAFDDILVETDSDELDDYSDADKQFFCKFLETLENIYGPMEKIIDCREMSKDGENFTREIRREFAKLKKALNIVS